ncbi:hypothetical protein YWS52_03660 [Chitiniphilus shinanonensis]
MNLELIDKSKFDLLRAFRSKEWIEEQKHIISATDPSALNRYQLVLRDGIDEIFRLFVSGETDEMRDLADALHCLGDAIQNKNGWDEFGFWASYIVPYEKKWRKQTFKKHKRKLPFYLRIRIFFLAALHK